MGEKWTPSSNRELGPSASRIHHSEQTHALSPSPLPACLLPQRQHNRGAYRGDTHTAPDSTKIATTPLHFSLSPPGIDALSIHYWGRRGNPSFFHLSLAPPPKKKNRFANSNGRSPPTHPRVRGLQISNTNIVGAILAQGPNAAPHCPPFHLCHYSRIESMGGRACPYMGQTRQYPARSVHPETCTSPAN